MTTPTQSYLYDSLVQLKCSDQYRQLSEIKHKGAHITYKGQSLLNLSSNDYLGLGSNADLQSQFLSQLQQMPQDQRPAMGATSSRLLTGNHHALSLLEEDLIDWYQGGYESDKTDTSSNRTALVLNSGYHANIGILPALAALPVNTLILADKRVHASLIDGMRLSQNKYCQFTRYRHNDYAHLASIIERTDKSIERIIIVTESVFSMDGDRADLKALVNIKANDARIELYVDEAHAVGVIGASGLGVAQETQTLPEIDYLIGTFGKAFASMGAYIICDDQIKQWLINKMRSLIYSTALPPIIHQWTRFILAKIPTMTSQREYLAHISHQVQQAVNSDTEQGITYQSPIIPYILGDSSAAVAKSSQLQQAGFYALPIRPPTVPVNTSRIRLVMNAGLSESDCQRLIQQLK